MFFRDVDASHDRAYETTCSTLSTICSPTLLVFDASKIDVIKSHHARRAMNGRSDSRKRAQATATATGIRCQLCVGDVSLASDGERRKRVKTVCMVADALSTFLERWALHRSAVMVTNP